MHYLKASRVTMMLLFVALLCTTRMAHAQYGYWDGPYYTADGITTATITNPDGSTSPWGPATWTGNSAGFYVDVYSPLLINGTTVDMSGAGTITVSYYYTDEYTGVVSPLPFGTRSSISKNP